MLKHNRSMQIGDLNGVKVLKHDLFTNDVLYTEIVFSLSSLKQELLPLVPLFWYDSSPCAHPEKKKNRSVSHGNHK